MGCPNLCLSSVLEINTQASTRITHIMHPFVESDFTSSQGVIDDEKDTQYYFYPPSAGSLFFAVAGAGAYARSLGMAQRAAQEVTVSDHCTLSDSLLCESMEASHGNRELTTGVANNAQLSKSFLRLDGQCKLCIVGAGAAEGNMRLPTTGYIEKIWDHTAGYLFVKEAGGCVTDLSGNDLDFSTGRELNKSVNGILASNGRIHNQLLTIINNEKSKIESSRLTE